MLLLITNINKYYRPTGRVRCHDILRIDVRIYKLKRSNVRIEVSYNGSLDNQGSTV